MTQGADHPVPTISTHVLDTERGAPAIGVHVTLYRLADDGRPLRIAQALTDGDGRVRDLLERPLAAGRRGDTAGYRAVPANPRSTRAP